MCTWGQLGARCAHNLKIKGKFRIRMEDNQKDSCSPMVVRSSHPKPNDMDNSFCLGIFLEPLSSLKFTEICDCLSKCPIRS